MLAYLHEFFGALAFSVAVEGGVVLLLCLLFRRDKWTTVVNVLIAVFGTASTIPYVWFVFPTVFWYSATTAVCLAEAFAFFTEALLYRFVGKLPMRQAFLFSFLANSASYVLGRVLLG